MSESKIPDKEGFDEHKEYIIDLNKVREENQLDGMWWTHINIQTFGYRSKIPLFNKFRIREGDILIHKYYTKGMKFPDVHYFVMILNEMILLINKDVRHELAIALLKYTLEHKKLPYACEITEYFKNGNVKIKYNPAKWVQFVLDVTVKMGIKHGIEKEMLHEYFSKLQPEKIDPMVIEQKKNDLKGR